VSVNPTEVAGDGDGVVLGVVCMRDMLPDTEDEPLCREEAAQFEDDEDGLLNAQTTEV
jgi:hypothetical protein